MTKEYFVTSDMHFEMDSKRRIKKVIDNILPDCDGIIIAGDLGIIKNVIFQNNHKKFRLSLDLLTNKYNHVIYVPGNHDYLFACREEVDKAFTRYNEEYENLDILNNRSIDVIGTKIIGSIGWHPDKKGSIISRNLFSDYRSIKDKKEKVGEWHKESCDYLRKEAFKQFTVDCDNGLLHSNTNRRYVNCIIVTHHTPWFIFHYPHELNHFAIKLMKYFSYDEFFMMDNFQTISKYWIFGHIHLYYNKKINNTTHLCNPMGYDFNKWKWYVNISNYLNEDNFIKL